MGSLFLLPAFIFLETSRVLVVYALLHSGFPPAPSLTSFLAELGKLLFASFFYWRKFYWASSTAGPPPDLEWENGALYAIPAACYLINNLLYFTGMQVSTPVLMHVSMMAKLPLTAIAHHFVITRQTNRNVWISLASLCVGLLIFNSPSFIGKSSSRAEESGYAIWVGPAIGLVIASISAGTGIATELLLKNSLDFWAGQMWLYLYGTLFGAFSYLCWDGSVAKEVQEDALGAQLQYGTLGSTILMTIMTGGVGLVVANLLRKKDNLVKLIGSSACLVTVFVAQAILYPALRWQTLSRPAVLGAGMIAIASWTYGFYRRPSKPAVKYATPEVASPVDMLGDGGASVPLLDGVGEESAGGVDVQEVSMADDEVLSRPLRHSPPQSSSVFDPTPTKIAAAGFIVGGFALLCTA